jgi:hypothetical protein
VIDFESGATFHSVANLGFIIPLLSHSRRVSKNIYDRGCPQYIEDCAIQPRPAWVGTAASAILKVPPYCVVAGVVGMIGVVVSAGVVGVVVFWGVVGVVVSAGVVGVVVTVGTASSAQPARAMPVTNMATTNTRSNFFMKFHLLFNLELLQMTLRTTEIVCYYL